MNQNVNGGFSYKAEWDNTPGNPGNKTATSKVGPESVVITVLTVLAYLNQESINTTLLGTSVSKRVQIRCI